MRPVCVGCGVEMHCQKNGAIVRANYEHYYSGDMYKCPSCGNQTIVGMGLPFHSSKVHGSQVVVDLTPKDQRCLFE